MKIAITLSLLCAAVIVSGCRTPAGGTQDEYTTQTGTVQQTEPGGVTTMPQDNFPNTGPAFTPP